MLANKVELIYTSIDRPLRDQSVGRGVRGTLGRSNMSLLALRWEQRVLRLHKRTFVLLLMEGPRCTKERRNLLLQKTV